MREGFLRKWRNRAQTFGTLASTAEFFDGYGIERDQFERIAQSDRVQSILDTQADFVREVGIIAVPTFLVAKHVCDSVEIIAARNC